jgi:nicotinamide riboside kinase
MKPIQKIVILGPESTGKSTLCAALAAHYQTIWTPEYARTYLSEHGTKYTYDDLLTIAKGQIKNEDEAFASLNKNIVDQPTQNISKKLILPRLL